MQVMFVWYHVFAAKDWYNWIRVYIAAYVWMTGFGMNICFYSFYFPFRSLGFFKDFMLNSAEYDISNANKYKDIKKFGIFQVQVDQEGYLFCS